MEPVCSHVFQRGLRKGQICAAKACKKHPKNVIGNNAAITGLPNDVVMNILHIASNDYDAKSRRALAMIGMTCKDMHHMTQTAWKQMWGRYEADNPSYIRSPAIDMLNHSSALSLMCDKGCQICKAPRIRKIYPEFAVRCCERCLYDNTISDYRLENDYMVDSKTLLCQLPFTKKDMYSPRIGYYTLRFFWKKDVSRVIGKSIEKYRSEKLLKVQQAKMDELASSLSDYPFGVDFVLTTTNLHEDLLKDPRTVRLKPYIDKAKQKYRVQHFEPLLESGASDHGLSIQQIKKTLFFTTVVNKADVRLRSLTKKDWERIKSEVDSIDNVERIKIEKEKRDNADVERLRNMTHDLSAQVYEMRRLLKSHDRDSKSMLFDKYSSVLFENLKLFHSKCPYCLEVNNRRTFHEQGFKQHFIDKHLSSR
jgi:hypothetical protein